MKVRIKNSKYICNFDVDGTMKVIISSSVNNLYKEIGKVLGINPAEARKTGLI